MSTALLLGGGAPTAEDQITPDHFRAALAFPFVYPPFKMNGKTCIEGSAIDTLCQRTADVP